MSLATRCPACQTVFRVVQDQLRVSEGWVRCGRCAEVFNALEHMVEVVRPAAAASPAPAERPEPQVPPPVVPPGTPDLSDARADVAEAAASGSEPPAPPVFEAQPAQALAAELGPATATDALDELPEGVLIDAEAAPFADAEHGFEELAAGSESVFRGAEGEVAGSFGTAAVEAEAAEVAESELSASTLLAVRPGWVAAAADAGADLGAAAAPPMVDGGTSTADEALPTPSFLRKAERAERWRRPAVRRTLALLLLLGLGGLVLQVLHTYRDLVAARWPESRALLEPMCEALGCRIEAPRWIDAVVVESTGLTRIASTNSYRLQVGLRNRAGMALALPALDLMLTDTQGKLVARRTLLARELGVNAAVLRPQGELALQATLSVAGPAVAGYTIEVFYP